MKKINGLLLLVILIALSSCYPKITTNLIKSYPVLDFQEEIVVIGIDKAIPDNAEILGIVRIGDTGFTNKCSYELVLSRAIHEAKKAGGNAIKITEHKPPSIFGSSCHRIAAQILKLKNTQEYNENTTKNYSEPVTTVRVDTLPKFKFSLNGGGGYQTALVFDELPDLLKDFYNDMKLGWQVNADFSYFIRDSWGFGIKTSYYNTSNLIEDVYLTNAMGNTLRGDLSSNLNVSFVGPSVMWRLPSRNNKGAFFSSISMGYMAYANEMIVIDPYRIEASTVGLAFDVGYDYYLSPTTSVGVRISSIQGALFSYDIIEKNSVQHVELEPEYYESLNRLDFSVGFVFRK